ncbi:MAG: class I SAM-dependent methyltransferase [Cytophagaceae bacterium]
MICPLCHTSTSQIINPPQDVRFYHKCPSCKLVFADPQFLPDMEEEKKRYKTHNNSLVEQGYVKFLYTLIDPALSYISEDMLGLDYGCGPVPVLSLLLQRHTIQCQNYDPLFGFEPESDAFDFVFASECFEHFHKPEEELDRIDKFLGQNGFLFIMTEQWDENTNFDTWYYLRDFTHVVFFHADTFQFIAQKYAYKVVSNDGKRRVILKK